MSSPMNATILSVEDLNVSFRLRGFSLVRPRVVNVVNGVNFKIKKGQILGLVGESGCGKTTTGLAILRLVKPDRGRIIFNGTDLLNLHNSMMKKQRQHLGVVFQDPYSSLDPRMLVKDILAEPFIVHRRTIRVDTRERIGKLLELVGLNSNHMYRYPHEFSGGQRQRIAIARALALDPSFVLMDEPTSALDVSVQAQILNLIKDLQKRLSLSSLFISHDLSVIKFISHQVAVMYLGKLIEESPTREFFTSPAHPYSRALLSAVPTPCVDDRSAPAILEGRVPSIRKPPMGCRFHTRCPEKMAICEKEEPEMVHLGPDHFAACFRLVQKTANR